MNLFIEIDENGNPVNHPATEENLIQAFGAVPNGWQPFVRVDPPEASIYQICDPPNSTYEFVNGAWTDVWHVRDMTDEEKAAFILKLKQARQRGQ